MDLRRETRKEGLVNKLHTKQIQNELEQDELDEGEEFTDKERKMRRLYILYENEFGEYNGSKNKKKRVVKSENCGMILELMLEQNPDEGWAEIINEKKTELENLVISELTGIPRDLISKIISKNIRSGKAKKKRQKITKKSRGKGVRRTKRTKRTKRKKRTKRSKNRK